MNEIKEEAFVPPPDNRVPPGKLRLVQVTFAMTASLALYIEIATKGLFIIKMTIKASLLYDFLQI